MKVGDAVRSKSHPDLGVMYVRYVEPELVPHRIVTVVSNDILIRGDSNMDDADFDDSQSPSPAVTAQGGTLRLTSRLTTTRITSSVSWPLTKSDRHSIRALRSRRTDATRSLANEGSGEVPGHNREGGLRKWEV